MNARTILEAETPKMFLVRTKPSVLKAGDDYYVGMSKPPFDYDNAGFCPFRLYSDGECDQLDGMYGLMSDIEDAIVSRVFRGPTPVDLTDEESDRVSAAAAAYLGPIHQAVKHGQSSGTVDGVAGPRAWQLVYWPRAQRSPKPVPNNFKVQ